MALVLTFWQLFVFFVCWKKKMAQNSLHVLIKSTKSYHLTINSMTTLIIQKPIGTWGLAYCCDNEPSGLADRYSTRWEDDQGLSKSVITSP